MRVLMEWVEWMWRVALSLATVRTSPGVRAGRRFIAQIDLAMRWNCVAREEVGVKCGCTQGCCVGARPGVRSWLTIIRVQVAVSKK